jgi:hypothetical protein
MLNEDLMLLLVAENIPMKKGWLKTFFSSYSLVKGILCGLSNVRNDRCMLGQKTSLVLLQ